MSREDFKLKALEYAMDLLKSNKDEQHSQELDYVLNILKEKRRGNKDGKRRGT